MSQDAVIRIRLDSTQARADLRSLYADFNKAPGARVPGGGGGGYGPGGGFSIPGRGGAGGGFNVSGMLGMLGGMGPLAMAAAAVGGAVLGPTASGFAKPVTSLLGDTGNWLGGFTGASQFKGAMSGIEGLQGQMAERFGMARGLGLMSGDQVRGVFDSLKPMAMAEGEGKAQVGADLSWKRTEEMGERLERGFNRVVDAIDRVFGGGGGR